MARLTSSMRGPTTSAGAAGSDAVGWREGTNVAVLPIVSCGSCRYCAAGAASHCAQTRYLGMGPHRGGFAELAVVPARHALALPGEMTDIYAALVEPFAVGLHGIHSAQVRPEEDVLVIGAGGVGLTTVAWARALRAQRVTAVDPDPARRELAVAMGATDGLASVEQADTDAYDAAVECVGHQGLLQACQPALRPQGRIVSRGHRRV